MERTGDQGLNFVAVAGDIGEEAIHCGFEVCECWEVLIVERLALEQPPQPLDQVEDAIRAPPGIPTPVHLAMPSMLAA